MSGSSDTLKFRLPTHGDAILSKMNALREDRRFCDVTLLLCCPQGASAQFLRFHAHRVVLAASSDFLRDQFLLHEGEPELSVGVVSSMEVGKRLLLSCYTGLLEVPLRKLVGYLTAASALQMSQVVEKCSQAVSQYLNPTLAFLKLERPSEEKEILQPHSGWQDPSTKNQEEREAAQPSTCIQEASTEGGETIVSQSKLSMSQGAKVRNQGLGEVREDRRVVKAKIESSDSTVCCFNMLESEKGGSIQTVHTNKPPDQVHHTTGALRCKLHPPTAVQDQTSSITTGCSLQYEEVADNSQNPNEMLSVAAPLQECGEIMDSRAHLSKSHCSGDELTENSGGILVQRPYLCRRCDRVFQHLESYMGHLKQHRQYMCLICGKGFSQKSNLLHHVHVHTCVKPFRCPLCHQTFSQKAPLQDHLKLHTEDRPYQCNYCAVHFEHKPGLRCHLKDTHGQGSLQNMLEEAVHRQ